MQVSPLDLSIPDAGELEKVNDYVYWLRMPLPFDLDHINLYLIKDNDGYAILDTGIGTDKTKDLWEEVFAKLNAKITKVIVTHLHPDHIGMAGYLVEKFKVPLYMTFSEYYVARSLVAGPRGADNWQDIQYLRRCGMSDDYIERAKENKGGIGRVVKPIPLQFERLLEGMELVLAGVKWKVMIGRGHSPEHACLYAKEIDTLISGDHILPEITPNIGVYSTEPNANSLHQYLSTLPQFLDLPDKTKVLPSHKRPFSGLNTRVNELMEHHAKHLDTLKRFCDEEARTVKDCLPVMFNRPLNPHNMFFAIAEALSHLNYLYFKGEINRSLNDKEQWVFER